MPSSDVRKLLREVRKQGAVVEQTRGGHQRIYGPGGRKPFIVLPSSPSDHRGLLNCRALLRRTHGYDV